MSKPPPAWLGASLAAAQHQDNINSWPWFKRWLHRLFIRHKCPACMYWHNQMKQKLKQKFTYD